MSTKKEIKTFDTIEVGDKIVSSDGSLTTVTEVYESHIPKSMFKLTLDNGEIIESSGNHLWYCETNSDKLKKDEYLELAKAFFNDYRVLQSSHQNVAYPKEILIEMFPKHKEFIARAADSLGWAVETPNVIFDNYMDFQEEQVIERYDYNALITFLESMRAYIDNKEGYFYYGKVRKTEDIFELMSAGADINIPTVDDISGKNKSHEK